MSYFSDKRKIQLWTQEIAKDLGIPRDFVVINALVKNDSNDTSSHHVTVTSSTSSDNGHHRHHNFWVGPSTVIWMMIGDDLTLFIHHQSSFCQMMIVVSISVILVFFISFCRTGVYSDYTYSLCICHCLVINLLPWCTYHLFYLPSTFKEPKQQKPSTMMYVLRGVIVGTHSSVQNIPKHDMKMTSGDYYE